MIFKKLRIRNIATIVDAEINFDEAPLADCPIFLIYGATGSGKTTILDSICLALYDSAPRLDLFKQRKRQFDDILTNKGVRNVNDVSNLIRRGTTDAGIQLEFVGNDSRLYSASWVAKFGTRGAAKGKLLDIERSLSVCGTDLIWDKKTDVERMIVSREVVGMNYDNFLKSTLLPQGAFNRFLAAGNSEKAEILERLAGLDKFTKLGERITNRYRNVSRVKNELESKVKSFSLLPDDERKELILKKDGLIAENKELEKLHVSYSSIISWIEKNALVTKSLSMAQEQFENHKTIISSSLFIAESKLLETRKKLQPLRTINEEIVKLSGYLSSYRNELYNLGRERSSLEKYTVILKNEILDLSTSILLHKTKLASCIREKLLLTNKPLIFSLLSRYNDTVTIISNLERRSEKLNDEVKELVKKSQRLLSVKEETERKEISIQANKEEVLKKIESVSSSPFFIYKKLLEVKELILKIQLNETEEMTRETKKQSLQADFHEAEKYYHKIELSTLEAAESLRVTLVVGDKCPVCNSVVKEIVPYDYFRDMLRIAEEPRIKARKRLDEAEQKLSHLKIEKQYLCNNLISYGYNWPLQKSQISDINDILEKSFDEIIDIETVKPLILKSKQYEEQYNSLIKKLENIDKELNKSRNEVKRADSQYNENKQLLDSTLQSCKVESEAVKQQKEFLKELVEQILNFFPGQTDIDSEKIKKVLSKAQEKIIRLEESLSEKGDRLNFLGQISERIHTALRITQFHHEGFYEDTFHSYNPYDLPGIVEDFCRRYNIITGRILSAQKQLRDAEKSKDIVINNLPVDIKEYVSDPTLAIDDEEAMKIEKNHSQKKADFDLSKALLQKAVAEFETLKKIRPYNPADYDKDFEEKLHDEISRLKLSIETNNRTIGGIAEALKQDTEKKKETAEISARYNEVCREFDMLQMLEAYFGEGHFRDVICEYTLSYLLENANYYLSRFSNRYEMFTQPGNLEVMIRDFETGEERVFSTLSGGETFMASLALALGLASLQNIADTPDLFFIDEGFGSLSADCLDSVMNTLGHLNKIESRRVGIVSHIEILQERIPIRLALQKNGSVTNIIIETNN